MKFNPSDFLDLAKQIVDFPTNYDEALARSIIGRAYFAAHLSARKKMRRRYPTRFKRLRRRGDEHKVVREILTEISYYYVASKLEKLNIDRSKADYDMRVYLDLEEAKRKAKKAIDLSEYVIQQIKLIIFK